MNTMQSLHFSPLKIASITDGAFWGGNATVAERMKNGNERVLAFFSFFFGLDPVLCIWFV